MIDHLPERLDLYAMAEAGRVLRGRVTLASLERVVPLLASDDGELDVTLELGRDEDGTHTLCGSISGRLAMQCQRCLENMEFPLDTSFRLGLVFSQEEAAGLPERYEALLITREPALLRDVVSDEVLLALPIVPMHGELAQCRALAEDYAVPVEDERENPFAILAQLKQKQ